MTREERERKLLADLFALAVEAVGSHEVDPARQDALSESFNAARALGASLRDIDDDAHARVAGAMRRYLWAVADAMAVDTDDDPRGVAAARRRREQGIDSRFRVCVEAWALRHAEPGITMRQAAIRIAARRRGEEPGEGVEHRSEYDIIRRAFGDGWSDPDSGWCL